MKGAVALLGAALLCAGAGPFDRYQVIEWQERSPAQVAGLARLGFTGTMLMGSGGNVDPALLAAHRASGLPWYVENILTDFLSPYHRWRPGKAVTWLFDLAKARLRADPGDTSVFVRDPGLSDPVWLAKASARLRDVVGAERGDHPLFYDLADEAGIGDLAAAWDADIGPSSLTAMRVWLQGQYPDLAALNAEWGTAFASWDAVMPELTDAAMRRTDSNYAAWADFKAWMDVAFARAVGAGRDAVHQADPMALAGLEGTQVPGWGGYDFSLLAPAVDVMEGFDAGGALDIAMAANPGLIALRTSYGGGAGERHAAWRHVLHGGRGTIVWDEGDDVVAADGSPLPRGAELGQIAGSIRAAPWLMGAQPDRDKVAVLVSQESFRTTWLLEQRPAGAAWVERSSGREWEANVWRLSLEQALRRLGELGVQPDLVTPAGVAAGALERDGVRVLILPHAIALAPGVTDAVARFVRGGGVAIADTMPGLFDGHSRRLPSPALAGVVQLPEAMMLGGSDSAGDLEGEAAELAKDGVVPRVTLRGPDGQRAVGVEARWLRQGDRVVLAVQTLQPWSGPPTLRVQFGGAVRISDVRHPGAAQSGNQATIALDPVEPTLLEVAPP